jgi:hypothetical protein
MLTKLCLDDVVPTLLLGYFFLDTARTCYSNAVWTLIFKWKAEVNGKGPIVPLATELAL